MSPVPNKDRAGEYVAKGRDFLLRQVHLAPEQVQARRLRAEASRATPRASGRRVVVLTPRDWAAHVQWESMIAHALRLRGADVRFVTCGGGLAVCDRVNTWEGPPVPCRTCTDYVHASLDAHGFERIAIRDGWDHDRDGDDWPELDELDLDELATVEYRSVPLGRLVDIPLKWFLMTTRLEDEPLAAIAMRRFVRSGRRVVDGLERAIDELRPDVVLLLNGLFFFEAIAWDLCRRRGIDVVTYERGFIKETLLFRRGVPACMGDISHLWPAWRDVPLAADEERELDEYLEDRRLGRRTIDRYWRNPAFVTPESEGDGRLVVLFTNLTWDSAVIGQEVAFPSIQDWLLRAVEAFRSRPSHRLVIRIHPAEVKLPGKRTREPLEAHLRDHCPDLPANVRVIGADDPTSSYPLMESADVGLVFTSTTGMELALHGTPTIVAGRTHYRDKGFTLDASSPAEFEGLLDDALADPAAVAPDRDLARRYAFLFFFRAPVASPGVVENVPGLARLTRGLDGLAPGADADVDRMCDAILDPTSDFSPPPGARR